MCCWQEVNRSEAYQVFEGIMFSKKSFDYLSWKVTFGSHCWTSRKWAEQSQKEGIFLVPFCRTAKPEGPWSTMDKGIPWKEEQDLSEEHSLPFITPIPAGFWNWCRQMATVFVLLFALFFWVRIYFIFPVLAFFVFLITFWLASQVRISTDYFCKNKSN